MFRMLLKVFFCKQVKWSMPTAANIEDKREPTFLPELGLNCVQTSNEFLLKRLTRHTPYLGSSRRAAAHNSRETFVRCK